ncbi:interleukin-1 receptor type 1 [Takifugu rubripes]|uniref:Zmp:0000000936 n=1 Tax=Takifugu rubripes TaxID=31033 RepID=H2UQ86_TAKRU|nr:interleukin-1 receptor type 1 [Takifugu rubripes]
MDLCYRLGLLLFFLKPPQICAVFINDNCTDYKLQFERTFTVPGDVAMLNSTLLTTKVFNFSAVPYNISWYDSATGKEMTNQTGRILVRGETLWFLNVTEEDAGDYMTIVRTATWCYREFTKLVVEQPTEECGRPTKAYQHLTNGATDILACPLKVYMTKLDSYNVTSSIMWYRDCEAIVDSEGRYTYIGTKLKIPAVTSEDSGLYTCTLSFTLDGVAGSVSETIDAWVTDEYSLTPQVHEPASEIIKAELGSNLTKLCRVFVPGVGRPLVNVIWIVNNTFLFNTQPSDRIYTAEQRFLSQEEPFEGMWLERPLMFSELKKEDFAINYTCRAYSARGSPVAYFTLMPTDPDLILPIGVVLGVVSVLFVLSVCIYYIFKVEIVLWFRSAFPVLYIDKDSDGKLYDAYVAYPSPCSSGYNTEVETFAIHTLPQVLEKACGYKLFIAGRDCRPGQAMVDSVEESLQASRRFLLLYNASTFRHTSNNNNIILSEDGVISTGSKTGDSGSSTDFVYDDDGVYSDQRQQFEVVVGMHRALLEGSLKAILVELEEISPEQLALFPESVRHLRRKQGAVCLWKNHRQKQQWPTCGRPTEAEKTGGSDTQSSAKLSPSLRFWKEVRYHMPVRGKRVVYPEKTALLNL